MIEFSSESIEFAADQMMQTLLVTNKGNIPFLFKVKTNNIKAIDARPSTGALSIGANVKITIKRNQNIGDGIKLLISYLECAEPLTKDNFKQLWAKYEANQKSKTLLVKFADKSKQSQKRDTSKFSSISNQSDVNLFQSVKVNRSKNLDELQQIKIIQQPQQVKKQKKEQQQKIITLTKELDQTKNQNKILQSKLNKQKNEIVFAQQNKQSVQKYLVPQKCKKSHIPFYSLILVAVLFFILGYYFGMPTNINNPENL